MPTQYKTLQSAPGVTKRIHCYPVNISWDPTLFHTLCWALSLLTWSLLSCKPIEWATLVQNSLRRNMSSIIREAPEWQALTWERNHIRLCDPGEIHGEGDRWSSPWGGIGRAVGVASMWKQVGKLMCVAHSVTVMDLWDRDQSGSRWEQ